MKPLPESLRSWMFPLCILFAFLFPMPLWIISACVAYFSMLPSTQPSFARRGAAAMLVLWPTWLVLFVIIMCLIGFTNADLGKIFYTRNPNALAATSAVMVPAWVLIELMFLVFADLMFLSTHTYVNSIYDLRRLRSINLGLNIAAMITCPPLALIGIPLTLVGMSHHRAKAPRAFGWSVACGSAAVVSVVVLILLIAIASSIPDWYTEYLPCTLQKKQHIETTTTWSDKFATTTLFSTLETTLLSTLANVDTTITADTSTATATITTADATLAATNVDSTVTGTTLIRMATTTFFNDTVNDTAWRTEPCEPIANRYEIGREIEAVGPGAAAGAFAILFVITHIAFLTISDKMILQLMPTSQIRDGQADDPDFDDAQSDDGEAKA